MCMGTRAAKVARRVNAPRAPRTLNPVNTRRGQEPVHVPSVCPLCSPTRGRGHRGPELSCGAGPWPLAADNPLDRQITNGSLTRSGAVHVPNWQTLCELQIICKYVRMYLTNLIASLRQTLQHLDYTITTLRGVSSCRCSSMGWLAGWPHLYLGRGQEFRMT